MNVNLEIYTFQNIARQSKTPYLVDWETVGVEENSGHNSEIVFLHSDTKKVSDGFEVTIYSNINIPSHLISNNEVEKGAYQRYEGSSTFYTDHNNITETMRGEFTLCHFTNCYHEIFLDTHKKTKGKNPYMIKILSLSKIILMIESDDGQK